jgi:16S rRNA (guanine527-N7)-methyltransferase
MSEFAEAFRRHAPEFGVEAEWERRNALELHFALVLRWNRKVNLTRITHPSEAVRFHYLESIWLAGLLPSGARRVVDVGSGAGFPGVPLAVARPEITFVLLEPHGRKATFLRESTRTLGLRNVEVVQERFHAERVGRDDVIVSRAVEQLSSILPSLLSSAARTVLVLASPTLLECAEPVGRRVEIVPVPASSSRAAGVFDSAL